MIYTITPTKFSIEIQLAPSAPPAATHLAKALQGRPCSVPGLWYLTRARARKWQSLFEAGFDAVQVYGRGWAYRAPDIAWNMPLSTALLIAPGLVRAQGAQVANKEAVP